MFARSPIAIIASTLVSTLVSTSGFATEIDFSQIKKCSDQPVQVLGILQGLYGADRSKIIQGAQVDAGGVRMIWDDGLTVNDEQDGRVYPAETGYYTARGFCLEQSMKVQDGFQTLEVVLREDRDQVFCRYFNKHYFQFRYLPATRGQARPQYQVRTGSETKVWGLCANLGSEGHMNPWSEISPPQRTE